MPSTMNGKTCVVSGASSGIGKISAVELAKAGARIVMLVRDAAKGAAVAEAIRANGGQADLVACDLASLASVRQAAAQVLALCPRIDVLLNNAGAMYSRKGLSAEGWELTLATNHLGPFLLTQLLLERLKASAPARIVTVASVAHWNAYKGIAFGDLRAEHGYAAMDRYGQSKLANILFTRELSRRLAGTNVTANCLHPGVIYTGFALNQPGLMNFFYRSFGPWFMLSPEQGAKTQIYLCSSPEVEGVSGQYYAKCKPARLSGPAKDEALAKRLWEWSEGAVISKP